MALKFQLNVEEIASTFGEFAKEVADDMRKAVRDLATLTRAQIHLEVQSELHSTRKIYLDNLSDATESSPGVWTITLDEPAFFIEEGIEPNHDMKPDLLKGKPYRVIPFKYNTAPTETVPSTQLLITEIKKKLRNEKIPYKKIEYNKDGSPKVGKLHDLRWGTQIPGGNQIPGRGNTPQLKGLSIYQQITKSGNVRRDILTFRTVSAGPKSQGKWLHPGLKAKHYMDKAFDEAMTKWEQEILPEIMQKWGR
jgi:hypothetical protein